MRAPHRAWVAALLLVVLAACRDVAAPPLQPELTAVSLPSPAGIPMLRQAADAPPLETYQVSFWAKDGEAASVTVNYQSADESVGQPFLRFDIPKNGLASGADGARFRRGDSILVTLTIHPVNFAVDFQPSGLWFSPGRSARLTIWYQNADPDLNGDGVVDAVDQALAQHIAMWGHAAHTPWVRLPSDHNATPPSVSTVLRHFSEYAVSW